MSGVVPLAERHRRKLASMRRAIREIDALLTDYARQHGGRFIGFGSTATGRMKSNNDVDIIADFAGELAGPTASYAEEIYAERSLACVEIDGAVARFRAAIDPD